MSGILDLLSAKLGAGFAAEGLDVSFGQVRVSDRPDLAQYQCNGAMAAAKAAKQNPRLIAERVKERVESDPIFSKVELAGPGFINLTLTDAFLEEQANAVTGDKRFGVSAHEPASTVVIDFGGPNVAKPLHVGHLRSTIIGDSLQRLFRFMGDDVTSDVHLGDWGLQMGQVLYGLEHPEVSGVAVDGIPSLDELEKIYPAVSAASKADKEILAACREITADLQEHKQPHYDLWRQVRAVSVEAIKKGFDSLGAHFDEWKGEADADPFIAPMVEKLKADAIAQESEGALVIFVKQNDDKSEIPPLILLKADGAAMYGTTDLGTIIDRVRSHDPDLILYVVDQRQHLHFEQVFRAARKAGINGKAAMEHIGFGTMNGPDGKPFKTREGGVMRLDELIKMATEAAAKRIEEAGIGADYPAEERAEIARQVGLAAIKFADLSNYRMTDYIFDLDRFAAFEGKTGPYLQYAAVRIKSILKRAEGEGRDVQGPIKIGADEERSLVLALSGLNEALQNAYDRRAPNLLCDYVYGIAQAFSTFYSACPVVKEEDEGVRASRLALCRATLAQLELVLGLLGIEIPERM